ncbi:hypothetical protein [Methylobacterium sp. Leaf108]|uniref:hypothetical protein n=1 Tax=Methylobacterium sp. Leaf108 TaxID=1736256 RepID=UPI0009E887D1|nr:hypothetical protein [Methylobacterium sp. Leaf108]
MSAKNTSLAALAAGVAMAFALAGVQPATAASEAVTTKVAQVSSADTQPALSPDTGDDAANCSRARRRLWVDGEGWIVRRVTTCR